MWYFCFTPDRYRGNSPIQLYLHYHGNRPLLPLLSLLLLLCLLLQLIALSLLLLLLILLALLPLLTQWLFWQITYHFSEAARGLELLACTIYIKGRSHIGNTLSANDQLRHLNSINPHVYRSFNIMFGLSPCRQTYMHRTHAQCIKYSVFVLRKHPPPPRIASTSFTRKDDFTLSASV